MKKIPTLFERVYDDHKIVDILPNVTEGMEWVLNGEGYATVKWDGSCCAIINGELYKRYDAKNGKPIPIGAIPCQEEPDTITGHMPCWVKCEEENTADKWFWKAYDNILKKYMFCLYDCVDLENIGRLNDGTYEAVGKHFQGNPYGYEDDILIRHGKDKIEVERSFEGIKEYLKNNMIEGIVFWKDGEPKCKIKRSDFGFEWNGSKKCE